MPPRLKLETFDLNLAALSPGAPELATPEMVEEVRLSSYEKGYAAGWDDAIAAQADDQLRIREDLARNLRDLSFTYQEARSHLLRGLDPLLRGMVDRILPGMARETLGLAVVAELLAEAGTIASAPVEIMVAPVNRAAIEAALGQVEALPITLIEEPSFADGQVHFRLGEEERALDLDALVSSIQTLVTQFLETPDDERLSANG